MTEPITDDWADWTPPRPVLAVVPEPEPQPWPVIRLDLANVLAFTPVWIFLLGLLAFVLATAP